MKDLCQSILTQHDYRFADQAAIYVPQWVIPPDINQVGCFLSLALAGL